MSIWVLNIWCHHFQFLFFYLFLFFTSVRTLLSSFWNTPINFFLFPFTWLFFPATSDFSLHHFQRCLQKLQFWFFEFPKNMASKTKSSSSSYDLTFLFPWPVTLPHQFPIPCLMLFSMRWNFQLSAFARSFTPFLNPLLLCAPKSSTFNLHIISSMKSSSLSLEVEAAPLLVSSLFPKWTLLIAFMLVVSLLTWVLLVLGYNLHGSQGYDLFIFDNLVRVQ